MPGHGERFVETFDDWFVRINKRIQRLERRVAKLATISQPQPQLLTNNSGFSGAVYYMATGGVVTIWSASISGSFPAGGTQIVAGANVPEEIRPRASSGNREGAAYLSSGNVGVGLITPGGNISVYHQSGATRTTAQITITYVL